MPFVTAPFVKPRSAFRNAPSFYSQPRCPSFFLPTRYATIRMQTSTPRNAGPYKVGFCLAGAATGGAYSAGVMDFLLEALAAWDEKKNDPNPDPEVPQWDVAVTEIIGTSAGGINSVLAINALNTDHQPLPKDYKFSPSPPENNSLFRVWVHEATYQNFLKTDDLDNQVPFKKVVASLFYADFMKEAVQKLLSTSVIHNYIPSWARDLHLSLTATNLRGVPYSVQNFTDRQGGASKYHMRKYADYTQFRVSLSPAEGERSGKMHPEIRTVYLNADRVTDETWNAVSDCARATASYPVGFPTVAVRTPRAEYQNRYPRPPDRIKRMSKGRRADTISTMSTREKVGKIEEDQKWGEDTLSADWNEDFDVREKSHARKLSAEAVQMTTGVTKQDVKPKDDIYAYSAVDGGVCNNEPFGLLRKNMERRNEPAKLDVHPSDAWGSVILVDPFPSTAKDPGLVEAKIPIVETIWSLFNAARGEASFKEEEISASLDTETMERFMIAPKAVGNPSQNKELATGKLGTFAGILDPRIPYHDFVLGRRNCKYFLQHVFVMDREDAKQNPIFRDHLDNVRGDYIPIIPVVGSAIDSDQELIWPTFGKQQKVNITNDVVDAIDNRMKKVLHVFMENLGIIKDYKELGPIARLAQFAIRRAAYLIEGLLRMGLVSMAESSIVEVMDQYRTDDE